MEKQLARVVNAGLAGEPQNIVLQVLETRKLIPFSKIKYIFQNGENRSVEINDGDFENVEIKHILDNMGHQVEIIFDESDETTMYF
jgi:hypothetical protein